MNDIKIVQMCRYVLYQFVFAFQEKFISLALAFKTDKMTLEKRIELHERSRDIAEQNVDKELEGLNEALKVRQFCLQTLRKLPKK